MAVVGKGNKKLWWEMPELSISDLQFYCSQSSNKAFGTASQVRRTSGTILLMELNIHG